MNKLNPYAPPRAALEDRAGEDCWREGNVLVMRTGSALPERCVKCNAGAVRPIKLRTFHWHPPGWYALILVNLFLYAFVSLFVRKKARVGIGTCSRHQTQRLIFSLIGWGGLLLGIALFFAGPGGIALGVLLILASAIAGIVGARLVYPSRITKEEIHLKGCGEAFLASLDAKQAPLAPPGTDTATQGRCPNCEKVIPLAAAACEHCQAQFGEGAAWKVEPLRSPDSGA